MNFRQRSAKTDQLMIAASSLPPNRVPHGATSTDWLSCPRTARGDGGGGGGGGGGVCVCVWWRGGGNRGIKAAHTRVKVSY